MRGRAGESDGWDGRASFKWTTKRDTTRSRTPSSRISTATRSQVKSVQPCQIYSVALRVRLLSPNSSPRVRCARLSALLRLVSAGESAAKHGVGRDDFNQPRPPNPSWNIDRCQHQSYIHGCGCCQGLSLRCSERSSRVGRAPPSEQLSCFNE
ncbi:hypothetical protein ABG768_010221 [Culter alburnus]|uniref:Uncharacterized protein n=1 Tax=Culter alburnus TaxID=194366 RepID=A0AAW1ZI86_CULAL